MGDEDAIRERLAAATPGPWRLQNAETYAVAPTRFYIGSELRGIAETRRGDAQARADAVFIAHASEDIAALLAENAALWAQLEALTFVVEAGFSSGRCPLCEPKYDMASGELYAHEDECVFKGWKQQRIDLPKLVAHLAEIRAGTDRAFAEVEAKRGAKSDG